MENSMEVKGKPRGRNGGRKFGSKDKGPRASHGLKEDLALRVSPELLHRLERQASLDGDTVSDCVRKILEAAVV